ncbi:MAG TPA: hypothetical protein VK280_07210 [Streptosporangiaceae bacterium]|nr:hypothetical protein [Streptosporangiaceae bacterium]
MLAVTSDRDAALLMLKSVSDPIADLRFRDEAGSSWARGTDLPILYDDKVQEQIARTG